MRVFITGIEGYIGTVLADELVKAGYQVAGLDAGFYRDAWFYGEKTNNYQVIHKDIRQITEEDLRGYEAVVHLAELANDPIGELNPETTFDISCRGTESLIEACKKAGVKKFIYFSSCSVYGFTDEVVDENSPVNPLTTYARAKVANEKMLLGMDDNDLSMVIFRNATVFGLSPRIRFDLAVNSLVGYAYTTREIKMESDGMPWRPFIHIRDIAEAVKSALGAPHEVIHKQIFNIGSPKSNYQIREIARIVAEQVPGCKMTLNPLNPDKRSYRANFDKANSLLPGFSPKRDVARGVRELYSLFDRIQLDKETFQSRHYTRLKQIKHLRETGQIDDKLFWVSEPALV